MLCFYHKLWGTAYQGLLYGNFLICTVYTLYMCFLETNKDNALSIMQATKSENRKHLFSTQTKGQNRGVSLSTPFDGMFNFSEKNFSLMVESLELMKFMLCLFQLTKLKEPKTHLFSSC